MCTEESLEINGKTVSVHRCVLVGVLLFDLLLSIDEISPMDSAFLFCGVAGGVLWRLVLHSGLVRFV